MAPCIALCFPLHSNTSGVHQYYFATCRIKKKVALSTHSITIGVYKSCRTKASDHVLYIHIGAPSQQVVGERETQLTGDALMNCGSVESLPAGRSSNSSRGNTFQRCLKGSLFHS